MVDRKLNEPIKGPGYLGKSSSAFWLREIGTTWFCRGCGSQQPKTMAAFEYTSQTSKSSGTGTEKIYIPVKNYLCAECGKELLTRALEQLELLHAVGKDAFRTVKRL